MTITRKAILSKKSIGLLTSRARNRIALALDCSTYTVDRWIRENEVNGDLTKMVPLQIIKEETGLLDNEILEYVSAEEDGKDSN
jgi:hypothetical protein